MIFILTGVFTQIGYLATEGITKSISKYLNAELLLEAEIVECEQINDVLMSLKGRIASKQMGTNAKYTFT